MEKNSIFKLNYIKFKFLTYNTLKSPNVLSTSFVLGLFLSLFILFLELLGLSLRIILLQVTSLTHPARVVGTIFMLAFCSLLRFAHGVITCVAHVFCHYSASGVWANKGSLGDLWVRVVGGTGGFKLVVGS